jgi:hypothetical protein
MSATTYVWGCVADEYGMWHQCHVEGETTAGGRFVAQRFDDWGNDPADSYAWSHPAPMEMKWRHADGIGRVVALRSMHDKLFAVAECVLSPGELEALAAELGPLRWSPGTSRVGRGPLELREVSLTPQPASVGLHAVSWHGSSSKGNMPSWVAADVKRGRADMNRSRDTIEVYERGGHWLMSEQAAAAAYLRHADDRYRHNPRELHYSGAPGRILAVGGRPTRRG